MRCKAAQRIIADLFDGELLLSPGFHGPLAHDFRLADNPAAPYDGPSRTSAAKAKCEGEAQFALACCLVCFFLARLHSRGQTRWTDPCGSVSGLDPALGSCPNAFHPRAIRGLW